MGEKGAVSDVNKLKSEKAKPDGHIEYNPNMNFSFIDQSQDLMAQFNFLQEAKSEIDAAGANAAMAGKEQRNMSGRALQARQQGGYLELGPVYDRHRMWKKRIYKQIWARIKQFWTEERWIRVTDDENKLKFVGLNQPVTYGEKMMEQVQAHSQQTGEQVPQEIIQQIQSDPRMQMIAEVRNPVPEMDMDIIIEEAPDVVTLQHEAFENLMKAMEISGQRLPLEVILEMMPGVPNKRQLLDKLEGDPEQAAAMQQKQQEQEDIQRAGIEAELEKTGAETQKLVAEAEKIEAQTDQVEADMFVKGTQVFNDKQAGIA